MSEQTASGGNETTATPENRASMTGEQSNQAGEQKREGAGGDEAVRNADGLVKKNRELLAEIKKLKDSMSERERAEQEKADRELAEQGNHKARLESFTKKFEAEKATWEQRTTKLQSALERAVIDQEIIAAAAEFQAFNPKQVLGLTRGFFRLAEGDDGYKLEVNDAAVRSEGFDPYDGGGFKKPKDLIKAFLDANPNLVKSADRGGAGGQFAGQRPNGAAALKNGVVRTSTGGATGTRSLLSRDRQG